MIPVQSRKVHDVFEVALQGGKRFKKKDKNLKNLKVL